MSALTELLRQNICTRELFPLTKNGGLGKVRKWLRAKQKCFERTQNWLRLCFYLLADSKLNTKIILVYRKNNINISMLYSSSLSFFRARYCVRHSVSSWSLLLGVADTALALKYHWHLAARSHLVPTRLENTQSNGYLPWTCPYATRFCLYIAKILKPVWTGSTNNKNKQKED